MTTTEYTPMNTMPPSAEGMSQDSQPETVIHAIIQVSSLHSPENLSGSRQTLSQSFRLTMSPSQKSPCNPRLAAHGEPSMDRKVHMPVSACQDSTQLLWWISQLCSSSQFGQSRHVWGTPCYRTQSAQQYLAALSVRMKTPSQAQRMCADAVCTDGDVLGGLCICQHGPEQARAASIVARLPRRVRRL